MNIYILQKRALDRAARKRIFDNWESMRRTINRAEAEFIEMAVMEALEITIEAKLNIPDEFSEKKTEKLIDESLKHSELLGQKQLS